MLVLLQNTTGTLIPYILLSHDYWMLTCNYKNSVNESFL